MQAEKRLFNRLGYQFKDLSLAETALTHRSCGADNNERLEFLGDAILNFIIAEALYLRFGNIPEGDLSRMRATLVKGKTLADIALEFDLGECLRLGSGEMKSGGHRRESILADTVEALIGAIYLDSGFEQCRRCVLAWYQQRLDASLSSISQKDAKTRLQEFLQSRNQPLPDYRVITIEGEAHQQEFQVSCEISLLKQPVHACGSSRKRAEQSAAEKALDILKVEP